METSKTQDWEEKQPRYADDNQAGRGVKERKRPREALTCVTHVGLDT